MQISKKWSNFKHLCKFEFKSNDKNIIRDILWLIGLYALVTLDGNGLLPAILSGLKHTTSAIRKTSWLDAIVKMFNSLGSYGVWLGAFLTVVIYVSVIWIAFEIYKRHAPKDEVHRLLTLHKPSRHEVKIYFLSILAMYLSNIILGALNVAMYGQITTKNNMVADKLLHIGGLPTVMVVSATILFAPFAEEMMFRGGFINVFFNKSARILSPSVILCGFVFSCFHMSTNPVSFLIYMIPGMILANAYEKTGSLKVSISIHATFNIIGTIGLLLSA